MLNTGVAAGFGLEDVPSVVSVGLAPFDDNDSTLAFGRFGGTADEPTVAFPRRGDGEAAAAGRAAQCAVRGSADAAHKYISSNA